MTHDWQGRYPVEELNRLPDRFRDEPAAVIDNEPTWHSVWSAFDDRLPLPGVDFDSSCIVLVRNLRYFNPIGFDWTIRDDRALELRVREGRSARPIQDYVNVAIAVVTRAGWDSISCNGRSIGVDC